MINSLLENPDFQKTPPFHTLNEMPLGFVDIGARGGIHELVAPIAGVTATLGFEPDSQEAASLLSHPDAKVWAEYNLEAVALGDRDADAVLHLLAAPTNHSLLPPNEAFIRRYRMEKFEKVGQVPLKTTTLDAVLFESKADQIFWGEFLKLDTQGTELQILFGCICGEGRMSKFQCKIVVPQQNCDDEQDLSPTVIQLGSTHIWERVLEIYRIGIKQPLTPFFPNFIQLFS